MLPDNLTEHRAIEFNAAQLAEVVTSCFEGYIVPFVLDGLQFERRFRPEGLDTQASVILKDGDNPAAVCLIARQGWTSRVAAMAIAPEFRRQGVGQHLMNLVIEEARARGDQKLVLEVIEQNPPAIGLYESVGLAITRRLAGYRREPSSGIQADLSFIDPSTVIRHQVTDCADDLPWDYRPETLCHKGAPIKGVTIDGKAFALISDASPERIIIWTLFTRQTEKRKGNARKLIEALAAQYPDRAMATPVALPDTHAPEFLAAAGFKEVSVSQYEMAIRL